MKILLKILLVLFLLILCFKNLIYRNAINYTLIRERKFIQLTDENLIACLEKKLKDTILTPEKITLIASELTNQTLRFTFQKTSNNPNKLVKKGIANCVGYSAMFTAIANYLISRSDINEQIKVRHFVGEIDFLGINLHQFFSSSFFKNHDYNVIEDKLTGTVILVDPSINDYLKLGVKTLH